VSLRTLPHWLAALQVFLVCGIPTQVLVLVALLVMGEPLPVNGTIRLQLVATLTLLDTALVAILIRVFLSLSGETSRGVLLGRRPSLGEALRGLALVPVVFFGVPLLVSLLRAIAPSLHTVTESPLEAYMDTPFDAAIFFVVAVLGGGVREELQRGFILHRFRQRLGGIWVGLALFSLLFGALHYDQGLDVALAIGALGVLLGLMYIRRGSVVMPMATHAGFNGAQVIAQVILRALK